VAGKSYSVKAIIAGVDHLTAPLRRMAGGIRTHLTPALRHVGRVAGFAGRAIRGILSPIGLLAGGGIVAGLGGLVTSFVETGDSIGEFAAQVGIGTTALQEYEYAAERAGVESGAFRSALQKFGVTLGKARADGGKFTGVLGKMPRSFQQALAGAKTMDEALQLALGALGSVKSEADRAALAQALFGKSGGKMALLAAQGADGIKELRKEAQRLGLVLSDDAIKAAGDADDSLIRLKGAVRGLRTSIASALLPTLLPLLRNLTDWIAKNRELIGQKIGSFVRGIVEWLGKVDFGGILRGVGDFFSGVKDVFDKLGGIKSLLAGMGIAMLAGLGPVGIALGGILATVLLIKSALDQIKGPGEMAKQAQDVNARTAVIVGSPLEAKHTIRAGAKRAMVERLERETHGNPAAMATHGFDPISGEWTGQPTAADYDTSARTSVQALASALRTELAEGPPTKYTAAALKLDLTVRRDGTVDATVTDSSGPVDTRIQTPRGVRMHGR
jgi:hypothetical protein